MHLHLFARSLVIAALLGCSSAPTAHAAARVALPGDPITAGDYQAHIDVLASDALQGRETGTKGERRAAAYIVSVLEELPGIEPAGDDGDWYQEFPVLGTPGIDGGRNVLAMLRGSDPELAGQAIVLGAHYDHVGFGAHGNSLDALPGGEGQPQIHNGADDNASGTAALLEIAAALATSDTPPRRTILFQWYSGEELGLLGSRWWADHPLFPLDDIVAMLNCDMIGRPVGSTLLVGGVGTAPLWRDLLDELRQPHDLELIYDNTGIAPSDNSSFYAKDIPVLFFFSGVHEDYHRPGDDADKIRSGPAARVVGLVHDVLRAVDARDERPRFTPAVGAANYFIPTVTYGIEVDAAGAGVPGAGVVAVLQPDSAAAAAGLREGDVLFRVDNREPANVIELQTLLSSTDDERSPHAFVAWRPRDPASAPSPRAAFRGTWSEWNAAYEWFEFEARPVVR